MNIKQSWVLFVCCCGMWGVPQLVLGKIIITEIMYDPAGTDTGREWVEIYNGGDQVIDLTTYRLFENNVAHTLKAHNAPAALLLASTYAIVADNPEKFLIDYPAYAGLLIDSAFSLNNTGELITMQTADGVIDSTVTYSVEWGAAGTENSLQLSDGIWIPALPTVALQNANTPVDEGTEDEANDATSGGNDSSSGTTTSSSSSSSSTNTTSTHNAQVAISTYKPKIKFEVSAGRDRYGFVNTPMEFKVVHNQDKTSGMKIVWSSGDGDYVKGKTFNHAYMYPGEYNLVLNASYQGVQSVARSKVFIRTPDIAVSVLYRGNLVDIMLENRGEFEVNVGDFEVQLSNGVRTDKFTIPPDTIISKKSTIILPSEYTKLDVLDARTVGLYYPNGKELVQNSIITQQ